MLVTSYIVFCSRRSLIQSFWLEPPKRRKTKPSILQQIHSIKKEERICTPPFNKEKNFSYYSRGELIKTLELRKPKSQPLLMTKGKR